MAAAFSASSVGVATPHWRRDAATLAARLPSLVVAARQVAQSVMHGVHGRRRAGPGETFWQFRPFISGEPAARVDWRRSARENRAFVREREWEASHIVWIWFDRSPSMAFASELAPVAKVDRAAVLALALAEIAVRGGERAGLIGLTPPLASRDVIERFAEAVAADERLHGVGAPSGLPPTRRRSRRARAPCSSAIFSSPRRRSSSRFQPSPRAARRASS